MAKTHTVLDLTVLPAVLRVYKAEVIRPVANFLRSFQVVKDRLKTQRQKCLDYDALRRLEDSKKGGLSDRDSERIRAAGSAMNECTRAATIGLVLVEEQSASVVVQPVSEAMLACGLHLFKHFHHGHEQVISPLLISSPLHLLTSSLLPQLLQLCPMSDMTSVQQMDRVHDGRLCTTKKSGE
jgi:hypothetical protein